MRDSTKIVPAILIICYLGYMSNVDAKAINAADCSFSSVSAAYNSASNGDVIYIPPGDCLWPSTLYITKNGITLQGSGIDSTIIHVNSFGGPLIQITANNIRITGFTFDGNYQNTTNKGAIRVGTNETNPSYKYGDFRIDHNKFIEFDNTGNTGFSAIVTRGYVYGVIDNNVFDDCTGECIDVCSDGVPKGISRSVEYGQYTNGTIYIEDNIWNYYQTGYNGENAVDSNSGARLVIRHNRFNIGPNSSVMNLIENHETCYTCSCDAKDTGDAGTLVMEIYDNEVYNYGSGTNTARRLVRQRGGRSLIYNNTVYLHDTYYSAIVALSSHRSYDYANCGSAAHARGYSEWCHDEDPWYTTEGRIFQKTVLSGDIDSSETTIDLISVAGFPTHGGSIIVDEEQIDYDGISGSSLTGCVRGANSTIAASHSKDTSVDLLVFGNCLEQVNHVYIWGNKTVGGVDKNDVGIEHGNIKPGHNDYTFYDIKSYTERPQNWQYRNDGYEFVYIPFPYPHPLRNSTISNRPKPPDRLRPVE